MKKTILTSIVLLIAITLSLSAITIVNKPTSMQIENEEKPPCGGKCATGKCGAVKCNSGK
ncbi:MAG: Unknown protein [uncultured Sulfurovum sp.]|uniref:Uncharacterized protein n=1 Tax=uncultured Sulfurovum sp. TaxID=269237 RepID=A0A6S6T9D8_9BACT|nr:MAG: Unknown protein [uncultured Sulfurovum sp.]